jgi:hypothetical protein
MDQLFLPPRRLTPGKRLSQMVFKKVGYRDLQGFTGNFREKITASAISGG